MDKELKKLAELLDLENDADLKLYDYISDVQKRVDSIETSLTELAKYLQDHDTTLAELMAGVKQIDSRSEVQKLAEMIDSLGNEQKALSGAILSVREAIPQVNNEKIARLASQMVEIPEPVNTTVEKTEVVREELEKIDAEKVERLQEVITGIVEKSLDEFTVDAKRVKGIQDILPKHPPQNAGGSGATFLKSMRDVEIKKDGFKPSDGDALVYSASLGKWIPGSGGIQTGTTLPSTGSNGGFFYDTDNSTLYVYQEVCFTPLISLPGVRLLQNGKVRLLQNGCARILQG